MVAALAVILVSLLLLIGLILRQQLPMLATARIPAALIAGFIGWCLWQTIPLLPSFDQPAWQASLGELFELLRSWPGTLIAVVFAGMLLSRNEAKQRTDETDEQTPTKHSLLQNVGRQGLMVWIIVIGQTTVGLWITWWLVQPWFELPNSTAMLIETGFAGGHGTAAAMGTVYESPTVNLREGLDLGILMATAGLVYALVSGVGWIWLAGRLGWVRLPENHVVNSPGLTSEPIRTASLGSERVSSDVLDPLLLQIIWLAIAFGIGWGLQSLVGIATVAVDAWWHAGGELSADDQSRQLLSSRLSLSSIAGSFPLFIYTLFGGAIVRSGLAVAGQAHQIDPVTVNRLVGTTMDLLVVAAVMTLKLSVVVSLWPAFAMLFVGGAVWSTFCLLFLSKKILPSGYWFELGLINFGMSTGTTATGFVLLRVVDPELTTEAAEDYALAAPLSAPFIGGGMLTVALPLLFLENISIAISTLVFTVFLVFLIVLGVRWNRKANCVKSASR